MKAKVAVGPGARGEDGNAASLDVKPGDRVLFGKWSAPRSARGEDLIIMKESDIMACSRVVPRRKSGVKERR